MVSESARGVRPVPGGRVRLRAATCIGGTPCSRRCWRWPGRGQPWRSHPTPAIHEPGPKDGPARDRGACAGDHQRDTNERPRHPAIGRVRTADEKAKAEDAVRKVDGVKTSANPPGGRRLPREAGEASRLRDPRRVEKALRTDRASPAAASQRYTIHSERWWVLLAGRAKPEREPARHGRRCPCPGVAGSPARSEGPNKLTDEEIGRYTVPLAHEDRGMTDAREILLITSATKLRLRRQPPRRPHINVDTTTAT